MPLNRSLNPLEDYLRHSLRIVLVEPAGGLNVGAIARVMKNMGLYHLVLVNPKCDPNAEETRRMAVHANDVLESAVRVKTVAEALQGCQRAVATTARDRDLSLIVDEPHKGLAWLLTGQDNCHPALDHDADTGRPETAILFGPEDRGLSNAELIHAQRLITINTNPDYESLNLAQAVAICCYELRGLIHYEPDTYGSPASPLADGVVGSPLGSVASTAGEDNVARSPLHPSAVQSPVIQPSSDASTGSHPLESDQGTDKSTDSTTDIASLDVLEHYYQHLESVLLHIGYLYPHTAKRRMEKFRVLFNRSSLTRNEVAMLRGILRQIEWAIATTEHSANPSDH